MRILELKNKKVIIYGDKRFIKDFLYIFNTVKPAYIVDDNATNEAVSWRALEEEKNEEIFVIICKYDNEQAIRNLEEIGLKRREQFCIADSLFEQLDFPIKEISKNRDIYVWGIGEDGHNFFHSYVEQNPDVAIIGCIDSDEKKQGKRFFGCKVYSPKAVLENVKDAFIIITSSKFYWEIKQLLESSGKKENIDFVFFMQINHHASRMLKQTIYDIPRLDYVCPKVFNVLLIKAGGRSTTCVGIAGQMKWNVPLYYSEVDNVWHSNILKVIRLSAVNGTYTFCNSQRCNLLENCEKQELNMDDLHITDFYLTLERKEIIVKKPANPINTIFNEENYSIVESDGPQVVECGWDKTCNLHCASCREKVWTADEKKEQRLCEFSQRMKEEMIIPYVERLNIAGHGEVFASNAYKTLLFDSEIASHVNVLGVLSNGILFNKEICDRVLEIWNKVNVIISMDGATKETAEKLRRGINFDIWKRNMEYIGEKRLEGKIKSLSFNFVVQRDNYLEMIDFVKMCLGFHADDIRFSKINNYGTYAPEEFQEISMFDVASGEMKPELQQIVEDEIFKRKEVHLFEWLNWEERD